MDYPLILANLGIEALSDMQQNALRVISKTPNVVLLAPTGSGKTLAFMLPLLDFLDEKLQEVQMLVLSPTRELANQTFGVFKEMKTTMRACCLHGGRPAMIEHRQINDVRPHLLIGTPGRVLDHLNKNNFSVNSLYIVVVDEFDKMLELKFQDELNAIIQKLSFVNRCVLVSATRSELEIRDFIAFREKQIITMDYLDDVVSRQPRLSHWFVKSPQKDKLDTLRMLLCNLQGEQAIVFVNFREAAERVFHYLKEQGFNCTLFHGGLEQEIRERNLYIFIGGSANVLVSTDLAARGLDIRTLKNVVHYHLPLKFEDFQHRCGRTGRWEDKGDSYLILSPSEDISFAPDSLEVEEFLLNPRFSTPVLPKWSTLYIGKGKRDKISRGDVVGFLCKQGGAKSEEIGRIDLRDRYCYVAIKRTRIKQILSQCVNEKIKKQKTCIELMNV